MFEINYDYVQDGQLTVDTPIGTVLIHSDDTGIRIMIYTLHVSNAPVLDAFVDACHLFDNTEE